MKIITAAQLQAIYKANEALKGTAQYSRYYMEYEYKHNNKWNYGGCGVPLQYGADLPVRTYKGNKYIMISSERRYTLTDEVEALITGI